MSSSSCASRVSTIQRIHKNDNGNKIVFQFEGGQPAIVRIKLRSYDLDLDPMTSMLDLDRDIMKLCPLAINEVCRSR